MARPVSGVEWSGATLPPKIMRLSVDSIQPDVMDVGVEKTFSPQNFSMFSWE